MWCGLRLAVADPPGDVDPVELRVGTEVALNWPGLAKPTRVKALIDTGCPVGLIASPRLSELLRAGPRHTRVDSVDWGGRVDCEVFPVVASLGEWVTLEVYAPLDHDFENLLGLPALMNTNVCIRGPSRSVYFAHYDPTDEVSRFILRDRASTDEYRRAPIAPGKRRVPRKR